MTLRGYAKKYDIHNGVGYVYEFENGYGASEFHMMGRMVVNKVCMRLQYLTPLEIYVTVLLLLMM